MTEPDVLARAAVTEIADRAPRPPSLTQLEGHTPLPHGAPPWVTRALAALVLVALVGLVVRWAARMGDDADYVTGGPETTASVTTAAPTTAPSTGIHIDPTIDLWRARIAGRTITYTAEFSCFCDNSGPWRITERDGVLVSATFLGTDRPTPNNDPFLFSSALDAASRADGFVEVQQSSPTSLSISVDVLKDAIDDEFGYTATDITIQP